MIVIFNFYLLTHQHFNYFMWRLYQEPFLQWKIDRTMLISYIMAKVNNLSMNFEILLLFGTTVRITFDL